MSVPPLPLPAPAPYQTLAHLVTASQALGWDHGLYCWGTIYYVGHLLIVAFIVGLSAVHGAAADASTAGSTAPAPAAAVTEGKVDSKKAKQRSS